MLFVGALFARDEHYRAARPGLEALFGSVFSETPPSDWDYSDYYENELGSPILRRFIFFERLIPQEEIARAKLGTIELEARLAADGRRVVNLDPGYLTLSKVVLATTKDYSHRICLGGGIFAEVTLSYVHGGFMPHVFTYRDYRDDRSLRLFEEMRGEFRKRLAGI